MLLVMAESICLHILVAVMLVVIANGAMINHESKFSESSEESARCLLCPFPQSKKIIATEFRLYTLEKKHEPVIIKNSKIDSWNPAGSGFNAAYKTKFITHGFQHSNAEWPLKMKDALLKKENMNVFVVDWGGGDGPIYGQAVSNTAVVGDDIALLVRHLMNTVGLKPKDVHLIGHSLGAHVSGFGGKRVQALVHQKVGRISGLDPAGPSFYLAFPSGRLDATDALFVDAIHTNWALNRISGFGIYQPVAHFDFYPNGGEEQPGCLPPLLALADAAEEAGSFLSDILDADEIEAQVNETVEKIACSHSRAYELFTASIEENSCKFESRRCNYWYSYLKGWCGTCADGKCIQMGYYADQYKDLYPGEKYKMFFLSTTDAYPYCTKEV